MRILALADIHGSHRNIDSIIRSSPGVDGILLVGDLTRLGDYREAALVVDALTRLSPALFAVPGNMDRAGVLTLLEERRVSLHGKGVFSGDIGFFGVGGSNKTPFHTPTELSEKDIGDLLSRGYRQVEQARRLVLASHVPPAGTRLDRTRFGIHAGSHAVQQFLAEHRVDLCLCGHIHEAFGEETVHQTRCVNLGAAADGRYALITIEENNIEISRRKI